ncbi:hypothetical protein N656DRAFT_563055 [Canariomyces notabilis]|uniref:SUR7 protein n=1 Tax=Canariomyces notabilis TaxID=2074819 RepID=A0AAN6QB93_9PEZI|nr:hypothetical protein N656DRAFT_563055 [Canariomyces arenarius]
MRIRAVRPPLEQVSSMGLRAARTTIELVSRTQMHTIVVILIPVVSLVLSVLALVAGGSPGLMEDYHIFLNTSMLGRNHDVAGKLQPWYSLHAMSVCEGTFTPSTTTQGAGFNVTSYTQLLKSSLFNISALLDHQLDVGPVRLNLAKSGFAKDLLDELDKVRGQFQALAGLYISAVAFSGLSLLLCIGRLLRPTIGISSANVAVALLAAFMLFVGNIIVAVSGKAVDKINNVGQHVGLSVSIRRKFVPITWTAFVMIAVMAAYWAYQFRQEMKGKRVVSRARQSGADL